MDDTKPYVSDVMNYKTDIEPNKVNLVLAGVGAGKNYFNESLATYDSDLGRNRRVLIITSRRLKVDQTVRNYEEYDDTKESVQRFINKLRVGSNLFLDKTNWLETISGIDTEYSKYMQYTPEFGTTFNTSVICTNAMIETVLKRIYKDNISNPDKYKVLITMFWKLFDLIVIDECHSIISDAKYQEAPFHIKCLIEAFYKADTKCRMILQTGTPTARLKKELKNIAPDLKEHNLLSVCKNIKPTEIWLIKSNQIKSYINHFINIEYKRVIYFSNKILVPHQFLKSNETGLSINQVATVFSDEDKMSELTEEELKIKHNTEESIKSKGRLPDNIELLLTTAKLKEGIDLYDEDIGYVIVDTKNLSDIVQYTGRIRKGNFILCFVTDAWQHISSSDYKTIFNNIKMELKNVTDLNEMFSNSYPTLDEIRENTRYISKTDKYKSYQFNFFTCKFEKYDYKIVALEEQKYFQDLFYVPKQKATKELDNKLKIMFCIKTVRTIYDDNNIKVRDNIGIMRKYFDEEFVTIQRRTKNLPTYTYEDIREFFVKHNFIIRAKSNITSLNSYLHIFYPYVDCIKVNKNNKNSNKYYFIKDVVKYKEKHKH